MKTLIRPCDELSVSYADLHASGREERHEHVVEHGELAVGYVCNGRPLPE